MLLIQNPEVPSPQVQSHRNPPCSEVAERVLRRATVLVVVATTAFIFLKLERGSLPLPLHAFEVITRHINAGNPTTATTKIRIGAFFLRKKNGALFVLELCSLWFVSVVLVVAPAGVVLLLLMQYTFLICLLLLFPLVFITVHRSCCRRVHMCPCMTLAMLLKVFVELSCLLLLFSLRCSAERNQKRRHPKLDSNTPCCIRLDNCKQV